MTPTTSTQSVLASLRSVTPRREANFDEALRIAELQAAKLTECIGSEWGLHDRDIAGLPRVTVAYEDLTVSGMSHWNGYQWIITLAKGDSAARQRFTLLHEFKHIIDHGQTSRLYPGDRNRSGAEQAEAAADFFAGCALVGKRYLKSAWGNGIQRITDLAQHFGVSEHAIRVRLAQTGLDVITDRLPAARCARPISTPKYQPQRFRIVRPAYSRRSRT
jgi:Zn-dependent peptidase ImmA (M78 family)